MTEFLEKWAARLSTFVFLLMLSAPLLGQIFSPSARQAFSAENRALAAFPAYGSGLSGWVEYPEQVDAWMEDNVGYRTRLIGLHTGLREAFDLDLSRLAIRGDDGWYFATINNALRMHQGLLPYAPGEAETWLEGAQIVQAAATEEGAEFVVLIAPNKHTIYPEKLTEHPVRLNGQSRAERLRGLGPEYGVPVIYPREPLLAAKPDLQLYYRTDTHWTSTGAYISYRALLDALGETGFSITPINPSRIVQSEPEPFSGDIYGLLGIEDGPPEMVSTYRLMPAGKMSSEALPDFDWNSFPAVRQKVAGVEGPSVLIYGDSFSYSLLPYMLESFSEVTFVHHQNITPPLSALDTGDYDLVVLAVVERMLSNELALR